MVSLELVGGTVLPVAVCDCLLIGLWLWARFRSSSCLAAGVQLDGVVKLVGGVVLASCCVAIALYLGFGWVQTWSSSCLAAGCNWMVSLELVGGTSGSCRDR